MNEKPKCPVFGCTIPRGIPHEHPAGGSSVMRDPVAPLTRDERAELEGFRRERDHATREGLKAFSNESLHGGRKLRDALMLAGQLKSVQELEQSGAHGPAPYVSCYDFNKSRQDLAESGIRIEGCSKFTFGSIRQMAPRRTLTQSIGKFMAWMFGIPALLLAAFAIGTYSGWWV